jgi:hypothetical protein
MHGVKVLWCNGSTHTTVKDIIIIIVVEQQAYSLSGVSRQVKSEVEAAAAVFSSLQQRN